MSSSSGSTSAVSDSPHHVDSSQQLNRDVQDDMRTRRHATTINPYVAGDDQIWGQRESLGYGAGVVASTSSSSSRAGPQGQPESSRHSSTPFAMSNMPVEARRQSIMAMDRKRRLTGSTYDTGGRRRNVAGGFDERNEIVYHRGPEAFQQNSNSQVSYPRHRYGPASSAEVIDLTSSPPQAAITSPNLTRRSSGSASGVYVVPRWQHDSEVTECPICRRAFTFLFRRHHCRKCGRVVCNDCSPHRITIPRQFIVNPPGPSIHMSAAGGDTVDLTGDDEDEDVNNEQQSSMNATRHYRHLQNAGIGGGEKVRLCNPCVPDPQPDPQPNFTSSTLPSPPSLGRRDDLLSLSDALRSSRQDYHHNGNIEPFPGFVPQRSLPYAAQSSRSRPLPSPPQLRSEAELEPSQLNPFSYPSNDRYRQRGHMILDSPHTMHNRHHSSENARMAPQPGTRPRMRSMLEESYLPRMFSGHPPLVRPRLNEDDICPICRRALPLRGPGGDESAREAHIMGCISARDPSNQSSSSRGLSMVQSPPRGPMHMLPFVATEKDCVGDEGNIPECSICMVEYDVGDELARLECLCKFHRECISAWFTRKQECPVHKVS